MEPSLLDYARFHGIAFDYTAIDPIRHINDAFEIDSGYDASLQTLKSEGESRLHNARVSLTERIQGEKLNVPKEGARFIMSIVRAVQADLDWGDILPAFHRIDDAKLEPLIFSLEYESEVTLPKRPLRSEFYEIDVQLSDDSYDTVDDANLRATLRVNKSLVEQIKKEKLRCARETLSILQSMRGNSGPSAQELEDVLGSLLKMSCIDPFESVSPFLLPLRNSHSPPPSPTPVPDDHMLPSPVSPNFMRLDLDRGRLNHESFVPDSMKARSSSSCDKGVEIQRQSTSPAGGLRSNTSRVDSPQCALLSSSHNNQYNREEVEIADVAARPIEPPVARISDSIHEGDEYIHRGSCDSPLLEIADTEESSKSHSEPPKRNAATSISKPRVTQKPIDSSKGHPLEHPHSDHEDVDSTRSTQKCPVLLPARVNLGSLSSFMETRGKGAKEQVSAKSPYFAVSKKDLAQHNNSASFSGPKHSQQPAPSMVKPNRAPLLPTTHVPRAPTQHGGLVLFVSTALLKTHLRVIQSLEGAEHPPKLVYRDYISSSSKNLRKCQSSSSNFQIPTPEEADIILSPKTGIILTTSQATMQLYLPGHKPTISVQTNKPKTKATINSPLREQIFRLSSRYEQLYIFISHGVTTQSKKTRNTSPQITTDKRMLSSFISLSAFCSSMSEFAAITPLLVPSALESVASWILALAHKHACQLPPPKSQPRHSIAFTPVNPKPQLESSLGSLAESVWESFLRRTGLNPYAAQVVLAVLSVEMGVGLNGGGRYESGLPGGLPRRSVGYLSRFVEMSSEERRVLFRGILGDKTVKRVDSLIEKDWQCDWALNFDDMVE